MTQQPPYQDLDLQKLRTAALASDIEQQPEPVTLRTLVDSIFVGGEKCGDLILSRGKKRIGDHSNQFTVRLVRKKKYPQLVYVVDAQHPYAEQALAILSFAVDDQEGTAHGRDWDINNETFFNPEQVRQLIQDIYTDGQIDPVGKILAISAFIAIFWILLIATLMAIFPNQPGM